MRITFELNDNTILACLPPAWQRARRAIAMAEMAGVVLGVSALFWAIGLRGALWGGWIIVGVALAYVFWRSRTRSAVAQQAESRRTTLELRPQGVHWHVHELKELRFDWRWFRRAGHTDQGLALELVEQGGFVVAPRSAFRSADEFRQACNFVDNHMLAAAREQRDAASLIERRWPLRTDLGKVLFRDSNEQQRTLLPQAAGRFWRWCLFAAALTLLAWALPGIWQTIVGTAAMVSIAGLTMIALQWLAKRRAARLAPPLSGEFVVVTDKGLYTGHRLGDEFVLWTSIADAGFAGSVLQFFGDDEEWIAEVNLADLSSPTAADEFSEQVFANLRYDEFDDESSYDDDNDFDDDETDEWPAEGEEEDIFDEAPRPSAPPSTIERILSVCAYFAPLVFFAMGIWGNWPFIELEHRRMELWRVPVFWMSEFTALFWYLVYGVGLLRGRTRPRGVAWRVWATFAAGFGMDLTITLSEIRHEHQAFARSEVSQAQATSAKFGTHRGERQLQWLFCEFADRQGAKHLATFAAMNTKFPEEIERAALAGQFPLPLEIRYDPERPQRHWLAATKEPHYNRLYLVGACVILFSTLLGLLFLLLRRDHPNVLPAEAAPFLAASFVLGLVGTLRLLFLGSS